MKYFSLARIKEAISHLEEFEAKWLIPALVFASNGATSAAMVNMRQRVGTDVFLDKFFSGSLIGLAPLSSGANTLRPRFSELMRTFRSEGKEDDYVIHQNTKLWANVYSRMGYKEMADKGLIERGEISEFRLTKQFQGAFEGAVSDEFRFENLLVWLYAFHGIEDGISSWLELSDSFQDQFLGDGERFAAEFGGRFSIDPANPVPWPADFLTERPSDEDFQNELMPSSFIQGLTHEDFVAVRDDLVSRFGAEFDGFGETEISRICSDAITGLISTKRLFVLGEPGIGKTQFAKLILEAFRDAISDERLLTFQEAITDKTTSETLIGYNGISGNWIRGSLTSERSGGRSLLVAKKDLVNADKRNQVNVILLDETNRRNIEGLLARFQMSIDSQSTDPKDSSHEIHLDAEGTYYLSPNTFWILTGNSPLNDQGRVVQSRPWRRRPNLLIMPNPLERLVANSAPVDLATKLSDFWERFAQTGLLIDQQTSEALRDHLLADQAFAGDLKDLFDSMAPFQVGLSYGLLEKLLRTCGVAMSLGADFAEASDSALATALGPLLATEATVDERSLKENLVANLDVALQAKYPELWKIITLALDSGSEYGVVRPFL